MRVKNKLVQGVGINDANYAVYQVICGKRVRCPFYRAWEHMLERCYNQNYKVKRPTYTDCKVCDEWLLFSNFKSWMEQQDWQDKHLDKDLLVIGNKVYSPSTCAFVDLTTNNFILTRKALKGKWPTGVCFKKRERKFVAQCSNPFTKQNEHLGFFSCLQTAQETWRKRKHELACQLAELQTDPRVKQALLTRYLNQ